MTFPVFVLTGIEKNEFGECPLYEINFSTEGEAKKFARERFYLHGWIETKKKKRWEIRTFDRSYFIERRKIPRGQ